MSGASAAIVWSAPLVAVAADTHVGDCLVLNAAGTGYVLATDTAMAARPGAICEGVSLDAATASGTVRLQVDGPIDATVSGLAPTSAVSFVRRSTLGRLERFAYDGVGDYMGRADGSGRVLLVQSASAFGSAVQQAGLLFLAIADSGVATTAPNHVTSWTDPYAPIALTTAAGTPTKGVDAATGIPFVHTDVGVTMQLPAGVADAVHKQGGLVVVVWKTDQLRYGGLMPLVSTSQAVGQVGFELQYADWPGGGFQSEATIKVSNGSSYVIDEPGHHFNTVPALLWNVTAGKFTPTRAVVVVDGITAFDVAQTATLPQGPAAGPLTIGNLLADYAAVAVYSPAPDDATTATIMAALAAHFRLPQVVYAWQSPGTTFNPVVGQTRYYAFPSAVQSADRSVLALVCRNGATHASDVGVIEQKISTDGGVTFGAATTIASDTLDVRDPCLKQLSDGSWLLTYFKYNIGSAVAGPLAIKRSTDNGVTWTPIASPSSTFTSFVASSGRVTQIGSTLIWPIYGQNLADVNGSCHILVSTNNGATWPTERVLIAGASAGIDYAEANVEALPDGSLLALIRASDGGIYESTSTDLGVTWTAKVLAFLGNGAPRMVVFASGLVICVTRPLALQEPAIFRRISPGVWTSVPQGLDALDLDMMYAQPIEVGPGVAGIVYAMQQGFFQSEVHYRTWPEWQMRQLQ